MVQTSDDAAIRPCMWVNTLHNAQYTLHALFNCQFGTFGRDYLGDSSMLTASQPRLRIARCVVRPQLHQHAVFRLGVGTLGIGAFGVRALGVRALGVGTLGVRALGIGALVVSALGVGALGAGHVRQNGRAM